MARINVTGSALVVVSSKKLEDLMLVAKHRPNALKLMSEDGKNCIYAIGVGGGKGSINMNGATFSNVTHNTEGLATITMDIPDCVTDAKEYALDRIGAAIINIGKIEQTLAGVIEEIASERALVMESISVE